MPGEPTNNTDFYFQFFAKKRDSKSKDSGQKSAVNQQIKEFYFPEF